MNDDELAELGWSAIRPMRLTRQAVLATTRAQRLKSAHLLEFHIGSATFPAGHRPAIAHNVGLPRSYWANWSLIFFVVAMEFCMVYGTTAFLLTTKGLTPAVATLHHGPGVS